MAKKRGKKGQADDDWDGQTSTSESTSFQDKETEVEGGDEFGEALDWTYESRGSTRERGWERLAGLLRNSVREVRGAGASRIGQLPGCGHGAHTGRVGAPESARGGSRAAGPRHGGGRVSGGRNGCMEGACASPAAGPIARPLPTPAPPPACAAPARSAGRMPRRSSDAARRP
jgi:hypothetical protein